MMTPGGVPEDFAEQLAAAFAAQVSSPDGRGVVVRGVQLLSAGEDDIAVVVTYVEVPGGAEHAHRIDRVLEYQRGCGAASIAELAGFWFGELEEQVLSRRG